MRITNDILKLYLRLKHEEYLIKMQLNDLKSLIVDQNGALTADYIAVVKTISRAQIAPIKDFDKRFGKEWLVSQGLLKTISFKQVSVIEKPVRTVKLVDMSKD